jgi:hypothetical protein
MRFARFAAVEIATYGGLKKKTGTLPEPRSPARPVRYVFLISNTTKMPSYLGGWDLYRHERVVAKGGRTDQRWDAGVGVGGRKPGSSARVWRSLDADKPPKVEPTERGQHDNCSKEDCSNGMSSEDRRRSDPQDEPPLENPLERV